MTNMVVKPREVIGFGVTVATVTAGIVWWAVATFQSKDDANKMDRRIDKVETEISTIRADLGNIKADTSYIRGRLEPRPDK